VTAIHIPDKEKPLDYNPRKTGEFYDTCPHDGCIEVEAAHRNEGHGGYGQETRGGRETAHEWSIFSADRRAGGCGGVWTRTAPTGAARDRSLGREPKGLTQDAATARSYFLPSPAYQDQYDRIFKKGAYAPARLDEYSPPPLPTPCDAG
jgi:hypothetical protein